MKNESIGSEMIQILKTIQENYVPTASSKHENIEVKRLFQKVFFGGDNLTEERTRNSQGAMADGCNEFDRLEDLITKNEDWHAIRYIYRVGI